MKKIKVDLDVFATLANHNYNTLNINRVQMAELSAKYDVLVPGAVRKNKVGVGLYGIDGVVNPILIDELLKNENTGDLQIAPSVTRVAAAVSVAVAPIIAPVVVAPIAQVAPLPVASPVATLQNFIPDVDKNFVKWGNYKELETVFKSGMFFPVYVTGESGNGKTFSILQAAAKLKREIIRINFTSETCEEDLLGSYTLRDGNTVWQDGPVVVAMKKGAICLLDEFDLSNPNRITCLNAVLEGNSLFVKRTGELVEPVAGFTIIATANTKGKGGSGRYIGANSQNEAVLDRFSITIEQEYAGKSIEKKILTNIMNSITAATEDDLEFIGKLIDFGDIIRATYNDGGVDELLSTRRLIDMVKSYVIFGRDRAKAIKYGTNRFDVDTIEAFNSLYENLDARVAEKAQRELAETPSAQDINKAA